MMKENDFLPFVKCQNSSDDFTDFLNRYSSSMYDINFDSMWKHYTFKNSKLPQSGWKGHIACRPEDVEDVFDISFRVLTSMQCTFKVARSKKVYHALFDPHVSVTEANKFITFYPENSVKFKRVLKVLSNELKKYNSPNIFTDYQLPDNNPVQFRYGAFTELKKWDQSSKSFVYLMKLPSGHVIPDDRSDSFNVPEGIDLPFTKEDASWVEDAKKENRNHNLEKYTFLEILSQKNKGDVYLAQRKRKNVIIKTANPYIQNKENSLSAHQLLLNENKFLKRLQHMSIVPKLLDYFKVDDVEFSVVSYIDGISLDSPIANKDKEAIIYALCKTVYTLHKNNIIIGDLTNSNFIYKDGICYLIDLEYVSFVKDNKKREAYTPYYLPDDEKDEIMSQQEDIFSLAVTILAILFGNLPKFNSKNIDNAVKALKSEIFSGIQLKREDTNLFYIAN